MTKPPPIPPFKRRLRFGLALGGGAARGWAHIGALKALVEADLAPDLIAGTSIGALVGGCFAAGKLAELEAFALSLTKRRVLGLLDVSLAGSGLISGDRLKKLLDDHLTATTFEKLPMRFTAIATEYGTGHEVWLTKGDLIEAMRASYALPGVFTPVQVGERWLMDGALVNPIPITAARAMGADIVACVALNMDVKSRGVTIQAYVPHETAVNAAAALVHGGPIRGALSLWRGLIGQQHGAPGLAAVMIDAFNITQDRISRSRLAGDPPDVMVSPRLSQIGLFEFHRAKEAIQLGYEAMQRVTADLKTLVSA